MVDELRNNAELLYDDKDRLQEEPDAITSERQWVITQARKGALSDSDMEYQLSAMSLQELSLKRELTSIGNAIDINTLENWDDQVREYFADLQLGLESLNAAPQNDEERQEIFTLKREIVLVLVERVTIDRNRGLPVHFKLDILRILREQANKHGGGNDGGIISSQIEMAGTYTRRLSTLFHPRHFSSCG